MESLIKEALQQKEVTLCQNGAIVARTGKRTGRSPSDKFIVQDQLTENTVDWGEANRPFDKGAFQKLWQKTNDYLSGKEKLYSSTMQVGADMSTGLLVEVKTELAWHHLFLKNLFITPTTATTPHVWQLLCAPGLHPNPAIDGTNSDGAVIIDFSERKVLIVGILYSGEMKKSMFSVLNYLLPEKNILPMHCSSVLTKEGRVALLFGLSGTGKTSLSADESFKIIGDDEAGWSNTQVFNFEGGCYAKCINLSKEKEPDIFSAITEGAVLENVVCDKDGAPQYGDGSITQNTRAAYPLSHLKNHVKENRAGPAEVIVFLTCDLYGVLPAVSLLSKEQARYYFLSGYTAKTGGVEHGQNEVGPVFSPCFGAPFFPRKHSVYADLLQKRLEETGAPVYLVNTGYFGGSFGKGGQRHDIATTRKITQEITSSPLNARIHSELPIFNLQIPQIEGLSEHVLDPMRPWKSERDYMKAATQLAKEFIRFRSGPGAPILPKEKK